MSTPGTQNVTLLEIGSQMSLGKIGSYWIGVVTNLKGGDLIRRKNRDTETYT